MALMQFLVQLDLATLGAVHVTVVGLVIKGVLIHIRRVLHRHLTVHVSISIHVHSHLQFLHAGGTMHQVDGTGERTKTKQNNANKN